MKSISRNIWPLLLGLLLILQACAGRKSKTERKDLIPENDLISVLTDVYIADGLLSLPKINRLYAGIDSITAYKEVIERHGLTQVQIDRTIRFYFIKKPKEFIRIYDKVLGRLSEMQSRIDKEFPVQRLDQLNLWQGRSFYLLPDVSGNQKHFVDFKMQASGYYCLKYTLTIYPDNPIVSPRLDMYIYNADSTGGSKKLYFPSVAYLKDGRPHSYKSILIVRNPGRNMAIGGWFVSDRCNSPADIGFIKIENIVLSRSSAE